MTIERGLRAIAGVVITASVSLAVLHSPWWLALTGFAGLNLLQSAFTNWCPMVWILQQAGLEPCTSSNGSSRMAATRSSTIATEFSREDSPLLVQGDR